MARVSIDPEVEETRNNERGMSEEMPIGTVPPLLSLPSALLRDVEQLINTTTETVSLLSESMEQAIPMRAPLMKVVDNLRICRHCIRRKKSPCIFPRLLVTGPPQTGKSALVDFVLHYHTQTTLENGSMLADSPGHSHAPNVDEDYSVSKDSTKKKTVLQSFCSPVSPAGNDNVNCLPDGGVVAPKGGGLLCKKSTVENGVEEREEAVASNQGRSESIASILNSPACGAKADPNNFPDDCVRIDTAQLSPVKDRPHWRCPHWNSGTRNRPFLKLGKLTYFQDTCYPQSVESDVVSFCMDSASFPATAVISGSLETTVFDRICRNKGEVVMDWLREERKNMPYPYNNYNVYSLPSNNDALCNTQTSMGTTSPSITIEPKDVYIEPSKLCRAPSWLLQEGVGGTVRVEQEGKSPVHLPDSMCADAVLFTISCEDVGTQRMVAVVNKLFEPLVNLSGFESCDDTTGKPVLTPTLQSSQQEQQKKGIYVHDEEDKQVIRQLISDMTFYVLTFSDAIVLSSEGVQTTDEQLVNRPPPIARSLPGLIALFKKEMRQHFGVHVDSWQIIPFSGSMSRVTRDVLTAIYEKRLTSVESLNVSETAPSGSPTVLQPSSSSPGDSAASSQGPPLVGNDEINSQLIISEYCDVIFGERFRQRRDRLSSDQMEEVVWQHALRDMWKASGARQILHTVRCFEWNSLQHIVSHMALSLVVFSMQMRSMLPQAKKMLRRQSTGLYSDLRRLKKDGSRANFTLQQLRDEKIPRQMVKTVLCKVHDKFEQLTVRFWWTLVTLLDEENERFGVYRKGVNRMLPSFFHRPLLKPSIASMQARDRLCNQYHRFLEMYVTQCYQTQMSHLRSIIEEEDLLSSEAALASAKLQADDAEPKFVLPPVTASTMPPNSVSPVVLKPKDHIPFVAENARDLKLTMQRELSLILARLNTEVINYFMAEVGNVFPNLAKMCGGQQKLARKKLLQLISAVNFRETFDVVERDLLHKMLSEISRSSFFEMRPNSELEVFVTGLRSALCQDQVKLYVKQLDENWNRKYTGCAATTLAYMHKFEKESNTREMRSLDFAEMQNASFLQQLREYSDISWAPMTMSELGLLSPNRGVSRSPCVGFKEDLLSSNDLTGVPRKPPADAPARSSTESPRKERRPSWSVYSDIVASEKNPTWFFLAVWQEALSAMTYRPWMLLQNMRYAILLNNITLIFLKGQGRLETLSREESLKIEARLQTLRQEVSCLGADLPSSLRHLSTIAEAVAHEMKFFNAMNMQSLSM